MQQCHRLGCAHLHLRHQQHHPNGRSPGVDECGCNLLLPLLPRAVTRTSRDWMCPSSGNFACIEEARLDMTAVLMATCLTSSRTIYSAKGGDPVRLKKLYRAGISSRHTSLSCKARIIAFFDRFHKLTTDRVSGSFICWQPATTQRGHCPRADYLERLGISWESRFACQNYAPSWVAHRKRCTDKQVNKVPDVRSRAWSLRMRAVPQRQIVDQRFAELYMSAAEHLPTDDVAEVHFNIASDDWATSRGMLLDIPTLAATRWSPDASIESESLLAVFSTHAPKQSLQHGHLVDLWWQFVAWRDAGHELASGEGQQCPCWATFWKSWSERRQHSQCDEFWQYGEALARSASSVQEKQTIAHNWREHLRLASR